MAKTSGPAAPEGKGGTAGGGKAVASEAAAKVAHGGAKAPSGHATDDQVAAKAAKQAPGTTAGTDQATGGIDEPCFEFRQVTDEDGNPVLRKFQIPCPEK